MRPATILTVALLTISLASAGPAAYAACQSGCGTVYTACYTAGSGTVGLIPLLGAPAVFVGCNAGYAYCQSVCARVALLAPTP